MAYFFKTEAGDILCDLCAKPCSSRCNDCHGELIPLQYTSQDIPDRIFRCDYCREAFIVRDNRVFREVTRS